MPITFNNLRLHKNKSFFTRWATTQSFYFIKAMFALLQTQMLTPNSNQFQSAKKKKKLIKPPKQFLHTNNNKLLTKLINWYMNFL